MNALKIKITKFIDAHQPGFVECKFIDAWGKEHTIEEKVPVVTKEDLDANSKYPAKGIVACEIIKAYTDKNSRLLRTVSIEKPWDISTTENLYEFDVLKDQIIEI